MTTLLYAFVFLCLSIALTALALYTAATNINDMSGLLDAFVCLGAASGAWAAAGICMHGISK